MMTKYLVFYQPPLWERYEQQVKEWEHAMALANTTLPNGCQDKAPPMEKPLVYAFCLKPRGLELPKQGFKTKVTSEVSSFWAQPCFPG